MRVVIQRVNHAAVKINDTLHASIGKGLLILLGIEDADKFEDIEWLCGKISRLRIFNDSNAIMNKSLKDIKGEILVVSQFTLHASTKKGNRPSYIRASKPDIAIPLYELFVNHLAASSKCTVKTGKFGAMMDVIIENNGPVTLIIDSKNKDF